MKTRLRNWIGLELARRSILSMGRTWPNPSVAAVLVQGGLAFSGGTEKAGKRHAEIVALDQFDSCISSKPDKYGDRSGMFVTLEPCSGTGRTGPCALRINKYNQIKTVRYMSCDPSLLKAGQKMLEEGGKHAGLWPGSENFAGAFLGGFLSRISGNGPRIHMKVASTKDGFMGHREKRLMISGERSSEFTMMLRSRLDAVVVGPGTIATDLPSLNLRDPTDGIRTSETYWNYAGFADDFADDSIGTGINGNGERFESWDSKALHGDDPFLSALFIWRREILRQIRFSRPQYEPDRVFILGRPFEKVEDFLIKQKEITHLTGKSPVFFLLPEGKDYWEGKIPVERRLPSLKDPNFSRIFRATLGQIGYNEIMVEGGAGLLETLGNNPAENDRVYLIRSKKKEIEGDRGDCIAVPSFILHGKKLLAYDLGDDELLPVSVKR